MHNPQEKFPEDIECIVEPSKYNTGAIFVSNIEAACNPETLKSNP